MYRHFYSLSKIEVTATTEKKKRYTLLTLEHINFHMKDSQNSLIIFVIISEKHKQQYTKRYEKENGAILTIYTDLSCIKQLTVLIIPAQAIRTIGRA